jgi:hypothetical protein
MRSGSGRASIACYPLKGQRSDSSEGAAVAGSALHIDATTVALDDFVRDV